MGKAPFDELDRNEKLALLINAYNAFTLRLILDHYPVGSIKDIPAEIFHHDPAVRAGTPFEQLMDRLVHYPAPVLAVVQGDAYGGAVEMLACTDLRVAADGVRLGVPPVRLGLV